MHEAHLRPDRIRACRLALGMTQTELARLIGRKQVDISRIESGKHPGLTVETLVKLADALDCEIDYLLGRCVAVRRQTAPSDDIERRLREFA